jgi:hypothetical protein
MSRSPFDLGLRRRESSALNCKRSYHPLQRRYIVRQGR